MAKINKIFVLALFATIFLISAVSATFYDWKDYGNAFTPQWMSQYESAYGRFDLARNVTTVNRYYTPMTNSYVEPLITDLGYPEADANYRNYLVIPYGSYLEIFDKYLNLYDEISTGGNVVEQISTTDWDGNGRRDDIVGLWDVGVAGNTTFMAFHYNGSTNRYSQLISINLNDTAFNFSQYNGVRSGLSESYLVVKDRYDGVYFLTLSGTNGGANYTATKVWLSANFTSLGTYVEPVSWYDIDGDSKNEFLYLDSSRILVFNGDTGTTIFHSNTSATQYLQGKFIQTHPGNQWRIAYMSKAGTFGTITMYVYRQDGVSLWSSGVIGGDINYYNDECRMAVYVDYDKDEFTPDNDIAVACLEGEYAMGHIKKYAIYKGYNGNVLSSYTSGILAGTPSTTQILTLADMNGDSILDFVVGRAYNEVAILDPTTSFTNITVITTGTIPSCVSADINVDGLLELICLDGSHTDEYYTGSIVNNNPTIVGVLFDPTTTIPQGQTLTVTTNATDTEGNPILYSGRCSDTANYSTASYSPIIRCTYTNSGTYNVTVRVKDTYHSTYNSYSYPILVTSTNTTQALWASTSPCDAGNYTIYSFTFNDEKLRTPLSVNPSVSMTYIIGNMTSYYTNSFTNTLSLYLCAGANISTYRFSDAQISYSTSGYVSRLFLPFTATQNTNVNHAGNLYDIDTGATEYQYTFVDSSGNKYIGKYSALLRYYPVFNQYEIVEMQKTDGEGKSTMYVESVDADYKLALYEPDGTLIKLYDSLRFANCSTPPCTYTPPSVPTLGGGYIIGAQFNLQQSLTFSNSTFTYIWNDPTTSTSSIDLTVYKITGTTQSTACTTSSGGNTGTINCAISGYGSFVAIASRTSGNTTIPVAQLQKDVKSPIRDISQIGGGRMGLFIAFIIACLLMLIGSFSPIAVIVLGIVALVPAYAMGSVTFMVLVGVAVLGGVAIHFMKKIG